MERCIGRMILSIEVIGVRELSTEKERSGRKVNLSKRVSSRMVNLGNNLSNNSFRTVKEGWLLWTHTQRNYQQLPTETHKYQVFSPKNNDSTPSMPITKNINSTVPTPKKTKFSIKVFTTRKIKPYLNVEDKSTRDTPFWIVLLMREEDIHITSNCPWRSRTKKVEGMRQLSTIITEK